jgi:DNA-binding NtrC family response regulator
VSSLKNSVIIVNDNTDLVNLFTDVLEQQRFVTYGFTDPSLALKKIKSNPDQFSLMLTDYPTPRGSEKTIAKEVKATNKNIKVILTTGYDLSSVDISDEGYDKLLQIPVKISTLLSTIREMLLLTLLPIQCWLGSFIFAGFDHYAII